MRIGILGGTFDPVHNGHIALAGRAMRHHKLNRVIFIPAYLPPHRPPPQASANHRLRMLRLALRNRPNFSISKLEIAARRRCYTVDTLRAFRRRFREVFFIVGSDELKDLNSWKDIKTARGIARFVSETRTDISATEVRRRVKAGLPIGGLVPPAVKEYILRHGLYKYSKRIK